MHIGIDLSGLLGGRMASVEGRSVPSGVGYEEGCPLPSWLGGLGERRELPQRGAGQSPGRKRILAYFEGHRTLIFVPIWRNNLRGKFALAFPYSKFWGARLVPLVPPVIYTHAATVLTAFRDTVSFALISCHTILCLTSSLFHFRLKTCLLYKSFPT